MAEWIRGELQRPLPGIVPGSRRALDSKGGSGGVRCVKLTGFSSSRIKEGFQALCRVLRRPALFQILLRREFWSMGELLVADTYVEQINQLQPDILHIHCGSCAA